MGCRRRTPTQRLENRFNRIEKVVFRIVPARMDSAAAEDLVADAVQIVEQVVTFIAEDQVDARTAVDLVRAGVAVQDVIVRTQA